MDIILKLSVILISVGFFAACSGSAKGLGVRNGKLSPCPRTLNCVMSQGADKSHHIHPMDYTGSRANAFERLKRIILSQKQAKIIKETADYIHVEYRSKLFRFVDDVEFYLPDNESVIHMRSASRLGASDLGVNRKRMENIRSRFQSSE